MNAVRAATVSRSRVALCALLLAGCLVLGGCGASSSGTVTTARSASGAIRRATALTPESSPRSARTSNRRGPRTAAARERMVSLAAARRSAAEALSAKREAAAIRAARRVGKDITNGRVLAAQRRAQAQARTALARAKKLTAAALAADPASCLKRSGALAATHQTSRSETRAQALRARAEVLKCLRESQSAVQAQLSASTGSGQ